MRNWTPEDIFDLPCPSCGTEIEFWKDEPLRSCPSCAREVRNPRIDLGCAEWCRSAEQCLGSRAGARLEASVCDMLIHEMKLACGDDRARAQASIAILRRAETLLGERGGDPLVIRSAAILHDMSGEQAAVIMEKVGISERATRRVVQILQTPQDDSLEARILGEARG